MVSVSVGIFKYSLFRVSGVAVLAILILVLILCLTFTYTNGFQDGSSVAASAIGSRALTAVQTACLVCTFEFLGALFGGSAVADAIHSITSWPSRADLLPVLAAGLAAAVLWNFITKLLQVPSSSTHALVGGVLGAVCAASGGTQYVVWGAPNSIVDATGVWKVVLSLFISPLLGFVGGAAVLCVATTLLMRASVRVNSVLKLLQWLTTAAMAFGHGANDTQKAMGIITLALTALGLSHSYTIPLWVRVVTGAVMAFGVASMVPGIVRRVGSGIYNLRPLHGLATQIASASILVTGSSVGGPVSATQVISSCVMGVGFASRRKGVHWLIARDMFAAWFLTIPCAAVLAWALYFIGFRFLQQFTVACL